MLDLEGYGLTLQQASKAIELGIFSLGRVAPTRHLVHTTEGKVIEWGIRKWMQSDAAAQETYVHVHIARQSFALPAGTTRRT
jgi:hypothetical protein